MRVCTACGAESHDEYFSVCMSCGAPLETIEDEYEEIPEPENLEPELPDELPGEKESASDVMDESDVPDIDIDSIEINFEISGQEPEATEKAGETQTVISRDQPAADHPEAESTTEDAEPAPDDFFCSESTEQETSSKKGNPLRTLKQWFDNQIEKRTEGMTDKQKVYFKAIVLAVALGWCGAHRKYIGDHNNFRMFFLFGVVGGFFTVGITTLIAECVAISDAFQLYTGRLEINMEAISAPKPKRKSVFSSDEN